jgi:hypothetical protein
MMYHAMTPEARGQVIVVTAIEGHVIQGAGARRGPGYRNPQAIAVLCVSGPVSDVDARRITQVQPVAQETEVGTKSFLESQNIAIEVARGVHVIGHDKEVFHPGQGHEGIITQGL